MAKAIPLSIRSIEDKTGLPIAGPGKTPTPITEIQWSPDDALVSPICISSTLIVEDDGKQSTLPITDVSVAYGNVVLADHGLTFSDRPLGTVPQPTIIQPSDRNQDRCQPGTPKPVPVRFRPIVPDSPITQAAPLTLKAAAFGPAAIDPKQSATSLLSTNANDAVPAINLISNLDPKLWNPALQLLGDDETTPSLRRGNRVRRQSDSPLRR